MRERSPIEVRAAAEDVQGGYYVQSHWMRAISLPECDVAYQKVGGFRLSSSFPSANRKFTGQAALGYISDMFL